MYRLELWFGHKVSNLWLGPSEAQDRSTTIWLTRIGSRRRPRLASTAHRGYGRVDQYAHTHAAAVETISVREFSPMVLEQITEEERETACHDLGRNRDSRSRAIRHWMST